MKRIITSILSLAFLSGIFVNLSFAEDVKLVETNQENGSNMSNSPRAKENNDSKKLDPQKYANKMEENEKQYSDLVNKEIEKIKNMSEKEFKKYLSKSYLILAWSYIRPVIGIICWCIFEYLFNIHFLRPYWVKTYNYAYEKGFYAGQSVKKGSNYNPEDLHLISDMKSGLRTFISNFHPDVLSKKAKDPNFFDKVYSEFELLFNKTKYFCNEVFFKGKAYDMKSISTEISGAIGKE